MNFFGYCAMMVAHASALQAAERVSLTHEQDLALLNYFLWFRAETARRRATPAKGRPGKEGT